MSFFKFISVSASILFLVGLLFQGWFFNSNQNISSPGENFSVMTYNVRYDNPGDSLNSWDHRSKRLTDLVKFYDPDFLGIQEGLDHQVQYLNDHLPGRKFIGVGRKDGKTGGEYSAIFYRTDRFSLISDTDSTLWLSPTPSEPSKGWDAALPRILTWGKFRSKRTGKELYVFNTHYDHIGDTARVESSKIINKTIKKIAGDYPVVLTGDFNATEDEPPYKILTSGFLKDAWYASNLDPVGPEFTSPPGFNVRDSTHTNRIDYIFVNDHLRVENVAAISSFNQGVFLSDHLPVYSKVGFSPDSSNVEN